MTERQSKAERVEPVGEVPIQVLNSYARLWQFETWLRTMVYVELRALMGDNWAKNLNTNSASFNADKSLTHMPTPEMNALSYAQLSTLLKLIDSHWNCFSIYLPPQAQWKAKLEEVIQIRHRVAHFRAGHRDDLARLTQFLRDIDDGFWRFCTSYNNAHPVLPPARDVVAKQFLALNPLPWVEVDAKRWAQIGTRDKSLPVGLHVRVQTRPWSTAPFEHGKPGHFYNLYLFAQDGRMFDLGRLLASTRSRHSHLVHFCLAYGSDSVRLTVPALLGASTVSELVQHFYDAALNAVRRGPAPGAEPPDAIAAAWPEYVLGPANPLTFLDPEMPCSFFNVRQEVADER